MNLTPAVETYFSAMRTTHGSGGATKERSFYNALGNLLDAVGGSLKPKVFSVPELAQQGAGHPDFGLYAAKQVQNGKPREGQIPECGVVEVKPVGDDAWHTAASTQVSKYWGIYQLVLVTNYRDFVLQGKDVEGNAVNLESFRLAESAQDFWEKVKHPRTFAREQGTKLAEYLIRALSHKAALVEPRDLAWIIASYARDGLARVEAAGEPPSLAVVRQALEEALGIQFKAELGTSFFQSTLVQTLFYGVFSAWVLWARQTPAPAIPFDWRSTASYLRVPVLEALYQQVALYSQLQSLGLVEVLDWTAAALERVDRNAFFAKFNAGEAVPYFYEPFLEAFDPDLRKQLGVWYTPPDVVRYMVARVDRALKDDLGIADGLAAENVYVLDPCCGTGTYIAETLRRISANLNARGAGALTGAQVKQAATQRVFGFEIMPAPFVVAHLQVGLTMQELDAPLSDDGKERAGVFLTNALTGWEPTVQKPIPFLGLEEERKRADKVKQDEPILVILGNPPYNGYAGMAVDEEAELTKAYRVTKNVRRPEGQGLNDLYIRFFRMAERRIAEKAGQGVVCFISNYSWLDGLSFTGMRERYLEAFDDIRIDCLNGDKYKTGKTTPDGKPDPSIFSAPEDPVGIQIGTAITTLVRKADHALTKTVGFRHLWGLAKREELTATAEAAPDALYDRFEPNLSLGLPFAQMAVGVGWQDWPTLPDLFPVSFPGVKTSRDAFLVDVDVDQLKARVADYFNPDLSHEEIARRYASVMSDSARYSARVVRDALLKRGSPTEFGFMRYAYRPFDTRWLYWEPREKLVDRPRPEYRPHVFLGNRWLVLQNKARPNLSPPQLISSLGDLNQMNSGVYCVPMSLRNDALEIDDRSMEIHSNRSDIAKRYLEQLGLETQDLFHHALFVLHTPSYSASNADALRAEGPRIPLPGWPDGEKAGAAAELAASAARGRELAALLDSDTPVDGVTAGALRSEIAAIAVPTTIHASNMAGEDFAVTAGWGHFGAGRRRHARSRPRRGAVTQCRGKSCRFGPSTTVLGDTTFDVYLNDKAYWKNVPSAVWEYKLGGYQVLKKWLSYREQKVLGRPLKPDEVLHFTDTARRIASILQLVAK